MVGVEKTTVRADIIGEISCSWPLADNEGKVLRAATLAQQQIGVAINVYPRRNKNGPLELIEVLREAGAQLNKVVISYMDRCGYIL